MEKYKLFNYLKEEYSEEFSRNIIKQYINGLPDTLRQKEIKDIYFEDTFLIFEFKDNTIFRVYANC